MRILRLLLQKEGLALSELAQRLDIAPSTLSEHLSVLREAGLVRDHGESDCGHRACYCIDARALRRLRALVVSL